MPFCSTCNKYNYLLCIHQDRDIEKNGITRQLGKSMELDDRPNTFFSCSNCHHTFKFYPDFDYHRKNCKKVFHYG